MMNADQIIAQYLSDSAVVTPRVADTVKQATARQQLYKGLLARPRGEFQGLLRYLLQEEVTYRNALWNGEVEDEDNCYEGIYRCAFLLAGCADPSDTLLLWKAKYINMDVGVSMGAEYFVGAGLNETLSFLEQCDDDDAPEIVEYLQDAFSDPNALKWQRDWEEERANDIRGIYARIDPCRRAGSTF